MNNNLITDNLFFTVTFCKLIITFIQILLQSNRNQIVQQVGMYYGPGTVTHAVSQWRHTRRASGRVAGTTSAAFVAPSACSPVSTHGEYHTYMTSWPHLESMTSHQKSNSVKRCIFHWRTILPNFIPIQNDGALGFNRFIEAITPRRRTRR